MLRHYLKIAFRNLWKYRLQSIISIVGLAVGYVCFAVSLLWIRYERSYDDFHDGAERMYLVGRKSNNTKDLGVSHITPYPLAAYLKQYFPEIEEACNTRALGVSVKVDDMVREVFFAEADSLFLKMFKIELLAGDLDFLIAQSQKVAITEDLSKTLFGNTYPIGQRVTLMHRGDYTVGAIIKDRSKHTNFPFQLLKSANVYEWGVSSVETIIKLKKGVDEKAFATKLMEQNNNAKNIREYHSFSDYLILPLTSVRYLHPRNSPEVAYKYIFLLVLVGGLVILCALLNYITLFVCRFRMRIREFSLRMICGATGLTLFALLITEFVLTLLIALLAGGFLIQLIFFMFRQLSNVYMSLTEIYLTSLPYIGVVMLVALSAFSLVLAVFRRRSLNMSIRKVNQNLFRKASLVLQLVISIGFIFCTSTMMKQVHLLHHTDIGIDYKNKGVVITYPSVDVEGLKSQLRQIPEITEVVNIYPLIPRSGIIMDGITVEEWDNMPTSDEASISMDVLHFSEDYLKYYNFRLLEGEMLTNDGWREQVLITESGAKALGWGQPVGKTLKINDLAFIVKGVVKDINILSPNVRSRPILLMHEDIVSYLRENKSDIVSFTCREGQWESCRKKIEALVRQAYPNTMLRLTKVEDTYNGYIKSETALIKLLSFVSLVCVIISIFGFVSLVSLTCEERRKEIAIRKINGASVRDILLMYFKEYFLLLAVGASIAFPAAYLIMKRWIEQYVYQTTITLWIYLSILLVLACVVVLCIVGRVYRVARENPAEAVKGEN